MAQVFTWCPLIEPQGTVAQRILTAQFGDGYQQNAGDGINNKVQSWPLQFTGPKSRIDPIRAFLDAHKGYISFLWTPPLGVEGYYKATGYQMTAHGAGNYTLAATFEQVFKP